MASRDRSDVRRWPPHCPGIAGLPCQNRRVPTTPRRTRVALPACLVSVAGLLAACGGGGGGGDSKAFCERVAADQDLLFNAVPDSLEASEEILAAYQAAGEVAPLSIESEWDEMTALFDTVVNGSVPFGDEVYAPIYASEKSALAIQAWLLENCGITITPGRVPNVVPPVVAATTVPGAAGPTEPAAPSGSVPT